MFALTVGLWTCVCIANSFVSAFLKNAMSKMPLLLIPDVASSYLGMKLFESVRFEMTSFYCDSNPMLPILQFIVKS